MTTAYTRDEIISISDFQKSPKKYFDALKKTGRFAISRNNKIEAVLLPVDDFEVLEKNREDFELDFRELSPEEISAVSGMKDGLQKA